MSVITIHEGTRIVFLGNEIGIAKYVELKFVDIDINLANMFGREDIKKVFIDIYFVNEATVKSIIERLNIYQDHGPLAIIEPEIGSIYFIDATFRFKSISRKHDETKGLLAIQFISAVGPQRH